MLEALGARRARRRAARGPPAVRRCARIARPDPAAGLLETIAVRDGVAVAPDEHLARLAGERGRRSTALALPADLDRRVAHVRGARGRRACRGCASCCGPTAGVEVDVAPAGVSAAPVVLEPVLVAGGLGAHKWADRSPLAGLDGPGRAGLLCDLDGTVLEASSANVWLVEGGRLVTPPADGRILPGVTRAQRPRARRRDRGAGRPRPPRRAPTASSSPPPSASRSPPRCPAPSRRPPRCGSRASCATRSPAATARPPAGARSPPRRRRRGLRILPGWWSAGRRAARAAPSPSALPRRRAAPPARRCRPRTRRSPG